MKSIVVLKRAIIIGLKIKNKINPKWLNNKKVPSQPKVKTGQQKLESWKQHIGKAKDHFLQGDLPFSFVHLDAASNSLAYSNF